MASIKPHSFSFICFSKYYRIAVIFLSTLLLASCSSDNSDEALSKIAIPSVSNSSLSSELKTIYTQTCAVCHTKKATGAPIAGDYKQWNKILSKGMDKVLDRVIHGYGGMPPAGQCFECSPGQLIELINFMGSTNSGESN